MNESVYPNILTNNIELLANNIFNAWLISYKSINFAEMKNVSRYIDLTFYLVVLPVMALIFPIERWFHNFPVFVISAVIWMYALYIVNRYITVPYMFCNKPRKAASICLILLSFAITIALSSADLYTIKPSIHDEGIKRVFPNIQQYQQAIWSLFMIVEIFSFAVGLLIQVNKQRNRRREVGEERDKAEIALYKAQIKPHFMFNTLNSLYGLFLTKDKKALISLERFITMMRYVHQSSQKDSITLAEEIDYIRQYTELQSLRLNEMTTVSMDINVTSEELMLPPMLLITFVENCFKHGVSSIEKSEIHITLHEKNGKVVLTTTNQIFPARRTSKHMGIDNCRRRLALLYPERHSLQIESDNNTYNVTLTIDITDD